MSRVWWQATAALLACGLTTAADGAAPIQALWGRNAELTLMQGRDCLTTLSPGLYEANWQGKAVSGVDSPGDGPRKFKFVTSVGNLNGEATIEPAPRGVHIVYAFTPTKPVKISSLYLGLDLAIARWGRAKWVADGAAGELPENFGKANLWSGGSTSFKLTAPSGLEITLTAPRATSWTLQDNREWGGDSYALRLNGPGNESMLSAPTTMEATVALSSEVELLSDRPVTLAADDEWVPLAASVDITPGSVLDLRGAGWSTEPAGRKGRLIARGDRMVFARDPQHPVRFYGCNLCFSAAFPTHETADKTADRLASMGYNLVRIHHYESSLCDASGDDTLKFNGENLDKLDYLIAALKQRGIYLTTDLFVSRPVKASESIGGANNMDGYKLAVLVDDKSRDNLKSWTRLIMNHVNPYTKLALKDDPELAMLSLVNEGMVGNFYGSMNDATRAAMNERYARWRAARGLPAKELPKSRGGEDSGVLDQFLSQLHTNFYTDMRDILRKEIGCPVILTDINAWSDSWGMQATRAHFDYVDNHSYWDHPQFLENGWRLPSRGGNGGESATVAGQPLHRGKAATQLLDRPFGFSEVNYAAPNEFRAESGPLMGAYGALQGWDMICRFAFSHSSGDLEKPGPGDYFNVSTDASQQATDRIAALLFRRDVAEARTSVALTASEQAVMHESRKLGALGCLNELSLVCRVGTRLDPPTRVDPHEVRVSDDSPLLNDPGRAISTEWGELVKRGVNVGNATDFTKHVYESDTGQLKLDQGRGLFSFNTAGSVGVFSALGAGASVGPLTIGESNAAIGVYVASVTPQPLASAPRLLLAHVPDVQATDRRFGELARKSVLAWGKLPVLVRDVATPVSLKISQPERCHVTAIGQDGKPLGAVACAVKDGCLTMTLRSRYQGQGVMYYEVSR